MTIIVRDNQATVLKKIHADAAPIITHLGNGHLVLQYLTVTPAIFTMLCKVAFDQPVNPGLVLVIPPGTTQFQIQPATSFYNKSTKKL